ncbi:MAG TPA: hypothetical protein VF820_04055 [Patescibacteria group bacterium]
MMRKAAIGFLLLVAFFSLPLSKAFALTANMGTLALSKTVLNPQTNTYVNNLGLNDPMYHPGEVVTFHITVANLGKDTVNQAVMKDTMPDYLTFTAGPGSYNPQNKTLSFFVYNIKPGTTQQFSVSAIVNNVTSLPTNQTVTCVANKVDMAASNNENAQDSASFCIQKTFAPVQTTTTPDTGPEAFSYITIVASALTGFGIKKFAKKA